jgi:multicomponent K+:H+ antiporter subunit C
MTYEFLVASAIGVLVAGGIFLALRARTFQVVLGLTLISYAVNLFLFASGRLAIGKPPIWDAVRGGGISDYADPLPQALVLTAIVITFGMTAFVVILALRSFLESGSDHVDGDAVACDTQDGASDVTSHTVETGEDEA